MNRHARSLMHFRQPQTLGIDAIIGIAGIVGSVVLLALGACGAFA